MTSDDVRPHANAGMQATRADRFTCLGDRDAKDAAAMIRKDAIVGPVRKSAFEDVADALDALEPADDRVIGDERASLSDRASLWI